jgi:ribosomal protein L18E
MISRTQINERMKKKTDSSLVETIFLAKKSGMNELAALLSLPTKKQLKFNISKLNEVKSDSVIVAGKILSLGEIDKKIKVYALKFSGKSKEKLDRKGCECILILDALKNLKKGEKIKGELIR